MFALAFGCNDKLSAMSGHSEVPEYRLGFGTTTCSRIQVVDSRDLIGGEFEVEHVEMKRDPFRAHGFRNG